MSKAFCFAANLFWTSILISQMGAPHISDVSFQGRGSHSAGGANAPPTFGPVAPRWEHAPPTFSAVKRLYGSYGDLKWSSCQCSLQKCKTTKHDNTIEMVAVAMHCNLRPSGIAPVVLALMHQPTKFQHNRAMND